MSGIRGKNTKPEMVVRSFLHRAGLRFRLHADLPGKPDLALRKYRTVVFVHGCFWHQHDGCRYATTPAQNADLWQQKFARNKQRDSFVRATLEQQGWRVEVVWSCQLSESELNMLSSRIRKRDTKRDREW